ncbi:hypothetical protein ALT721_2510003 [Alteromonas alvinellae]
MLFESWLIIHVPIKSSFALFVDSLHDQTKKERAMTRNLKITPEAHNTKLRGASVWAIIRTK